MFQLLIRYYSNLNHVVYHSIIVVAIVIGLLRFKKLNRSSRLFLLLLFITLLAELTAFYCAVKYHNNSLVYNLFNLFQFSVICLAFYLESRQKAIPVIFILFISFVCINSIFYQSFFKSFGSNSFLTEQLLVIVLYFMYLVAYFKNTQQGSLKHYPLFWIGAGWLLFSITSIVSFGFDYITAEGTYWDTISVWVKRLSNYVLYVSFSIAFFTKQKSLYDTAAGK